MIQAYLIFSTLVFGFLGTMWQTGTTLNFLIKVTLMLGTLTGVVLVLETFGYIVKM